MTETYDELECLGEEGESQFDIIVGRIEEIIIESEFSDLQQNFLEEYHVAFEPCEENKLEYMNIFNAYTELIEKYIESSLVAKFPEFSMKKFLQDLKENPSELDGEVFDVLVSFTDFLSFKEMLLDYKLAKEGRIPDLSLNNVSGH